MDWLDKLFESQATLQTAGYIGDKGPAAAPNGEYLTIDVAALWITHVRKGLSKFYGAIHGSVIIPHETGEKQEFQAFDAIADAKELDANHLDRIVQGPYRLLDSVPYRGGGIPVRIALLAIKSADLAAPYIQLLKSVSDVAGISFVSQAAPLVDVIHSGISVLAGNDSLEIGRYGLFDPVYTGYYAVVRAEPHDLPLPRLGFDEQSRTLTLDGNAVTDHPYFVLKISTSEKRDYWYNIPDIKNAYTRMKDQFRQTPKDFEKNRQAFEAFQVTVELSPDLLSHHAEKVVEEIRQQFGKFISEERMLVEETGNPMELTLSDFNPFP